MKEVLIIDDDFVFIGSYKPNIHERQFSIDDAIKKFEKDDQIFVGADMEGKRMSDKDRKLIVKEAAECFIDHAPWNVGKSISDALDDAIYNAVCGLTYNGVEIETSPEDFKGDNYDKLVKSLIEELGFIP